VILAQSGDLWLRFPGVPGVTSCPAAPDQARLRQPGAPAEDRSCSLAV